MTDAQRHFEHARGKASLWLGVLLPPISWALQHQIGYSLIRFACEHRWASVMHHVLAWLFVAAALAGGALAWRDWKLVGGGWPVGTEPGIEARSRFMAVLGMMLSALFALLIIGQWSASLFIDPCNY